MNGKKIITIHRKFSLLSFFRSIGYNDAMAIVNVQHATKRYGNKEAVCDISFAVEEGKCVCLLGPSGAGKSTLLKMITGQLSADEGSVTVQAARNEISMIFQNAALFPHITVKDNIAYGLHGMYSKKELDDKIHAVSRQLKIEDQLEKYPPTLSGGQQQRVSIARALIRQPKLLLLDEPTANLDIRLKEEIQEILYTIHQKGMTMILSSHDQKEAAMLSDEVIVLNKGKLEERGMYKTLYYHPQSLFTARFLGETGMNIVRGSIQNQILSVCNGTLSLTKLHKDGNVTVGFRKECTKIGDCFHIPFQFALPDGCVGMYRNQLVYTQASARDNDIFFTVDENNLNFFACA